MAAKQGMQIAVAEVLNDEKMTGTAQHSRHSPEHPERSVSMAAAFGSQFLGGVCYTLVPEVRVRS